jgi:hypothetical protein
MESFQWGLGIGDWGLGPIPNPQLNNSKNPKKNHKKFKKINKKIPKNCKKNKKKPKKKIKVKNKDNIIKYLRNRTNKKNKIINKIEKEKEEKIKEEIKNNRNEFKEYYFGVKQKPIKEYKPKESVRDFFLFNWTEDDDTTKNLKKIYKNTNNFSVSFGRGNLGGLDKEEVDKSKKTYDEL